jgi:hypothetical protein
MKRHSQLESRFLRLMYFGFGGIPALFLAIYATVFIEPLITNLISGRDQITSSNLSSLAWHSSGILGTLSGWLVFFGVGTGSVLGRAVHTVLLCLGMASALWLAWLIRDIGLPILPILPAIVGVCLVLDLWAPRDSHGMSGR